MSAVATARNADCWLAIDREWVIVSCGDGVPAHVSDGVSKTVWDHYPGSEPHFRPIYESAWEHGMAAGLVYWNDTLAEISAFVREDQLFVSFEYVTVAGLRASLERIAEETERRDSHRTTAELSQGSRRHLRAVQP